VDFVRNINVDTVEEAMSSELLCVEPGTSVRDVFQLLQQRRRGSVLVCRDEKLLGIFTERDALRMMARGDNLDQPIEKVMIANPVVLKRGDKLAAAIRTMVAGGYRRIPIVDEAGKPVGVVRVAGLLHYLVEHFPHAVYNLPPEPQTTMRGRDGA
jgi:CBS domain-containing protein